MNPSRPSPLRLPPHDFLQSRRERSASPAPVWKIAKVKLPKLPTGKRFSSSIQQESHRYPAIPSSFHVLSWDPPLAHLSPRTWSRDDLLFRKKYHKGVVVTSVILPRRRLETTSVKLPASRIDATESGSGKQDAPQVKELETSTISPLEVRESKSLESVTTLRVPSLFAETIDTSSSTHQPLPTESAIKRAKSKLPEGYKVAFSHPSKVVDVGTSSDMFMVMSELLGEEKASAPAVTESSEIASDSINLLSIQAAATGSETRPTPSTSLSTPPAMMSTLPSSSPWTGAPSLAFSMLDSQSRKVWSQPDERITSSAGPQTKTENSLQGISDDFPAALPRNLNEFKPDGQQDTDSPVTVSRTEPFPRHSTATQTSEVLPVPDLTSAGINAPEVPLPTNAPFGKSTSPSVSSSIVQDATKHTSSSSAPNAMSDSMVSQYPYPTPVPSGFHVPPGYQLVPIGSMPTAPSSPYSGYGMSSWSSSAAQANGYPPRYPQAMSPTYPQANSQSSGAGSTFSYAGQPAVGYKAGSGGSRSGRHGRSSSGSRQSEWNPVANGPQNVSPYYYPNAVDPSAGMGAGFTPFQNHAQSHSHHSSQSATNLYGSAQTSVPTVYSAVQMPSSPYGAPMHQHPTYTQTSYYGSSGPAPVGAGRARGRSVAGVSGGGSPYQAVPTSAFAGATSQRSGY